MTDFIIQDDGRPDDLIETREFPFLACSMLERSGIVRDDGLPRMLGDVTFAARAVAFAVFLILAVDLTRPILDLGRNRVAMFMADRTGDGAQTQVETA